LNPVLLGLNSTALLFAITIPHPYMTPLFFLTVAVHFYAEELYYFSLSLFFAVIAVRDFFRLFFPHKEEFHKSYEFNITLARRFPNFYQDRLIRNREKIHRKGILFE